MGKRTTVGLALVAVFLIVVCTAGVAAAQQSRVFVTSEHNHQGNLGGLAGADAVCQRLGATVDGDATWVAWLSTSTVNAKDRLTATGPFVRATETGVKIADDIDDLTDGSLDNGICRQEDGVLPNAWLAVWTGTKWDGTARILTIGYATCADWTTSDPDRDPVGLPGYPCNDNQLWTDGYDEFGPVGDGARPCSNGERLYCFEQAPEPVPAAPILALALLVLVLLGGGSAFAWRRRFG